MDELSRWRSCKQVDLPSIVSIENRFKNPVKQFNIKIHIEQDTVVTGQPLQNTDRYTSDHRPSFYKVFLKYSKEMIKTYIYTLKR